MTHEPPLVAYDLTDGIATIALNNPDKGNPFTLALAHALVDALDQADQDPAARVVILTARGPHFCVGADLSSGGFDFEGQTDATDVDWKEPAGLVSMRLYELNKPVIAALRGAAVGAGSTVILAADYRLAAPDTRLGYVFSERGIYPEGVSAWFLPRLVGLGTALDWMLSGRILKADAAAEAGLLHGVHEDVDAAARTLAQELAATTAPVSAGVIRRLLLHASGPATPYDIQRIDSRLIASIATSPDAAEGVTSFFERRTPAFPGRVPTDLPTWLPWLAASDDKDQ